MANEFAKLYHVKVGDETFQILFTLVPVNDAVPVIFGQTQIQGQQVVTSLYVEFEENATEEEKVAALYNIFNQLDFEEAQKYFKFLCETLQENYAEEVKEESTNGNVIPIDKHRLN